MSQNEISDANQTVALVLSYVLFACFLISRNLVVFMGVLLISACIKWRAIILFCKNIYFSFRYEALNKPHDPDWEEKLTVNFSWFCYYAVVVVIGISVISHLYWVLISLLIPVFMQIKYFKSKTNKLPNR
ncbi:hypothetical protein [Fructobacillus ficulneus]|uniref:hypothetical protein n=1 Tax=Fructobacillus ficulneus TaxID=157463 RepID=UPI00078169D3|nr:hypothetical protein [Fructobacillus ficulneus]